MSFVNRHQLARLICQVSFVAWLVLIADIAWGFPFWARFSLTFFGLLASGNQAWCVNAAVLVVFVSQKMREGTDKPLPTHSYDTGSAWMSLAYQAWISGYVAHGMAGFDYELARIELGVPKDFHVDAMCAIGRPGPLENLAEPLRARETPSPRKKVEDFAFEGGFLRPKT